MKFQGFLITPSIVINPSLPSKTILEFTKNQIIFPSSFNNSRFEDSDIKHMAIYKLNTNINIDPRLRYEIQLNNHTSIRLVVNKWNEKKLRWVHGMYMANKNPLAFISLIVAILALIVTTLIKIL